MSVTLTIDTRGKFYVRVRPPGERLQYLAEDGTMVAKKDAGQFSLREAMVRMHLRTAIGYYAEVRSVLL